MLALAFQPSVAALTPPLAASWWPYFEFMGVMHPAVSHFPIALLTVAGLVEAWSVIRRHKKPANATLVCLTIGTAAAVVATVLGWAEADRIGRRGDTLDLHRWLGLAVTVVAVAALVLSLLVYRADAAGKKVVWAYRINVFVAAALVGLVGSLGGKLVHGENYYTDAYAELVEATSEKVVDVAKNAAEEGVHVAQNVVQGAADAIKSVPDVVQARPSPTEPPSAGETTGTALAPETLAGVAPSSDPATPTAAPPTTQSATPTTAPVAAAATAPAVDTSFGGGRIDYTRDIQPIFEAHCVKCHNETKSKGGYRLDVVQKVFAAGETGATPILPGKSDESLLVKRIEGKGDYADSIMPPKGEPLTFQQIALIRRWIDEGAQPSAP